MTEEPRERGQARLSPPPRKRRRNIRVRPARIISDPAINTSHLPQPPVSPVPSRDHGAAAHAPFPSNAALPSEGRRRLPRSRFHDRLAPARFSGWVYTFAVLCIAYFGSIIAGGIVFGVHARSALQEIEVAQAAVERLDFDTGRTHILQARRDLVFADQGMFVLNLIKPIPYIGNQVRAVDSVLNIAQEGIDVMLFALTIGDDILSAAQDLRSILEEQGNFSFYDLPTETRTRILNAVATSTNNLQTMRVRASLALDELDKIDGYNVAPQILEMIEPLEELLPSLERSIDFLIPLTSIVREVAGVEQDRQWLILFLNNNEIRPGGGFIGMYGLMLTRDGELVSLEVQDVLRADALVQDNPSYNVEPPRPIRDYMGVDTWYFRDANWSPDFKESADTAVQLLRQQSSFAGQPVPEIHGVIGITPDVVEDLLAYLGPINLEGFTFTSENVRQLLQEETQFAAVDRGLTIDQRKDLIATLTDEVVDRLLALPVASIPDVIDILMDSFEDKQMAVRSYAEDAQVAIEDAEWGGVVEAPEWGDSLLIADANMAALKTDIVVDRAVTYTITPQAGRLRARVEITYIHKGRFDQLTSRYRTFTRIFVPKGAELIRVDGSLRDDRLNNPNEEPGYILTEELPDFTSFGTFTSVEPGRTQSLSFEYFLPDRIAEEIADRRYNLNFFKQMGSKNHSLTLDLDFDKNVRTALPAEPRRNRGNDRYEWEGALDGDLLFEVRF